MSGRWSGSRTCGHMSTSPHLTVKRPATGTYPNRQFPRLQGDSPQNALLTTRFHSLRLGIRSSSFAASSQVFASRNPCRVLAPSAPRFSHKRFLPPLYLTPNFISHSTEIARRNLAQPYMKTFRGPNSDSSKGNKHVQSDATVHTHCHNDDDSWGDPFQ